MAIYRCSDSASDPSVEQLAGNSDCKYALEKKNDGDAADGSSSATNRADAGSFFVYNHHQRDDEQWRRCHQRRGNADFSVLD